MTRALQTEAIIHDAMPTVPEYRTDLLRECEPPVAKDIKLPGLQPAAAAACAKQLDQAFGVYFRPAAASETDFLVCHGNVIRYLVMKALGADTRLWLHLSVAHTSLTEIEVRADGSMRVLMVGDVGHLPPSLQSGTGERTAELTAPEIPR